MVTEADTRLAGGRTLHAYDTRADETADGGQGSPVAVFWTERVIGAAVGGRALAWLAARSERSRSERSLS